jgi:hypothetical protein
MHDFDAKTSWISHHGPSCDRRTYYIGQHNPPISLELVAEEIIEAQVVSHVIKFLPSNTPKDANGHHLPNCSTLRPSRLPPTNKQVNNSSQHNSRHTKTIKNISPQIVSHIIVKKKMIHRFSISLAQVTSVHKQHLSPFSYAVSLDGGVFVPTSY